MLSNRTISALRKAGVTAPEKVPLGDLLKLPRVGVNAVTELAERIYGNPNLAWRELVEPPEPEAMCSHNVPVSRRCFKCERDAKARNGA